MRDETNPDCYCGIASVGGERGGAIYAAGGGGSSNTGPNWQTVLVQCNGNDESSTIQAAFNDTGYIQIPGVFKSISGISLGNTTKITANNHGLVVGDTITIYNVQGTTQLNGNSYQVVSVADANNFYIGTWTVANSANSLSSGGTGGLTVSNIASGDYQYLQIGSPLMVAATNQQVNVTALNGCTTTCSVQVSANPNWSAQSGITYGYVANLNSSSGYSNYTSGGTFAGVTHTAPPLEMYSHTHLWVDPSLTIRRLPPSGYVWSSGEPRGLIYNADYTYGSPTDTDISISGGIWDGGGAWVTRNDNNTSTGWITGIAFLFGNVTNLSLANFTIQNPSAWSIFFGNVSHALIENYTNIAWYGGVNEDGFHGTGPFTDLTIKHCKFIPGEDDNIALLSDANMANGGYQGNISEVLVEDLRGYSNGVGEVIRLLTASYSIQDVTVRDVDVTPSSVGALTVDTYGLAGSGNAKNIRFENFRNMLMNLGANVDNLELDNVTGGTISGWYSLIQLNRNIGAIGTIRVYDSDFTNGSTNSLINFGSYTVTSIGNIITKGNKWSTAAPFLNVGSNVIPTGNMQDLGLQTNSVGTGGTINFYGPIGTGICTGSSCTVNLPTTPASGFGNQYNVLTGLNGTGAISVLPPNSSFYVQQPGTSSYCSEAYGIVSSSGAASAQLVSIDSSHYIVSQYTGSNWGCGSVPVLTWQFPDGASSDTGISLPLTDSSFTSANNGLPANYIFCQQITTATSKVLKGLKFNTPINHSGATGWVALYNSSATTLLAYGTYTATGGGLEIITSGTGMPYTTSASTAYMLCGTSNDASGWEIMNGPSPDNTCTEAYVTGVSGSTPPSNLSTAGSYHSGSGVNACIDMGIGY